MLTTKHMKLSMALQRTVDEAKAKKGFQLKAHSKELKAMTEDCKSIVKAQREMRNDRQVIKALKAVIHDHQLTYSRFVRLSALARKEAGLTNDRKPSRVKQILSAAQLDSLWRVIDASPDHSHMVLFQLTYLTGCRVHEITSMKLADINMAEGRIYIPIAKGSRSRYVLITPDFSRILRVYTGGLDSPAGWLFPSPKKVGPISDRWVQKLMRKFAKDAGITFLPTPHTLRHQLITHLLQSGMTAETVSLVTGNSPQVINKTYSHIALGGEGGVEEQYQKAMGKEKK